MLNLTLGELSHGVVFSLLDPIGVKLAKNDEFYLRFKSSVTMPPEGLPKVTDRSLLGHYV